MRVASASSTVWMGTEGKVDDIPVAPNGKFQTIVPLAKETAG